MFWRRLEEALWMAYLRNGRNVIRQIIKDTNIHSSDSDRMIHPLLYACQGVRYRKLEVILTTVRISPRTQSLGLAFS